MSGLRWPHPVAADLYPAAPRLSPVRPVPTQTDPNGSQSCENLPPFNDFNPLTHTTMPAPSPAPDPNSTPVAPPSIMPPPAAPEPSATSGPPGALDNSPAKESAAPAPDPAPAPRTRSKLNQEQLQELILSEHLGGMAQKAGYAALLAKRKITAGFIATFLTDIAAVRTLNTTIVTTDAKAKDCTQQEATCQDKLLTGLRQIQAAARQEYLHTQPLKLEAYLVNEDLDSSRRMLVQSAATLLGLANSERPGGLDTEFLDQVAADHGAYQAADLTQCGEQTDAQKERYARNQAVESINQRRQQIHFAAEGLWPHRLPENAPARRDFKLPARRPYVG